jgi:hypothetical protein
LCAQVESDRQVAEQELAYIEASVSQQTRANILLANTLCERRHHLNVTKHTQETAAIKALHRNDGWLHQKLQKNSLHSKLWTIRDQTATLQVQPLLRRYSRSCSYCQAFHINLLCHCQQYKYCDGCTHISVSITVHTSPSVESVECLILAMLCSAEACWPSKSSTASSCRQGRPATGPLADTYC